MQKISKNHLNQIAKLKQKKYRNQRKEYILSGPNVVSAALSSRQINLKACFIREGEEEYLRKLNIARELPLFQLSEREFQLISDETHPQGIALLAAKPDTMPVTSDIVIYLDRVSDPGNLGTIIRTACWFGIKDLLLSPGSADPFQPKAVRSSAGLITHLNLIEEVSLTGLSDLKSVQGYSIIATYPDKAIPLSGLKDIRQQKRILAFGSEAHGLPEDILPLVDQKVMIPSSGIGESLNLAISVGIILYQQSL